MLWILAWPSHNATLRMSPRRRERVHRARMTKHVGCDALPKDRRLLRRCRLDVLGQSERKSVAGHRLPVGIEENLGDLNLRPDRKPCAQCDLGLLPQRQDPFTSPFAHDVHGGQGAVREIAQLQRYEFRHPQSASIGKMQHRAITGAEACPGIGCIEQSLDLGPVEVIDQRLVCLLGRDCSDTECLIEAGWNPVLDVSEEGSDRGEPAIAGPHAAAAADLHMIEEGHDHVCAEILNLEIGRSALQPIGSELDEEDEAVGIGLHRVRADGAFARQMFPQICREMGSKRRHAASP